MTRHLPLCYGNSAVDEQYTSKISTIIKEEKHDSGGFGQSHCFQIAKSYSHVLLFSIPHIQLPKHKIRPSKESFQYILHYSFTERRYSLPNDVNDKQLTLLQSTSFTAAQNILHLKHEERGMLCYCAEILGATRKFYTRGPQH